MGETEGGEMRNSKGSVGVGGVEFVSPEGGSGGAERSIVGPFR